MTTFVRTVLSAATPMAFVTVEALLIVAAGLAAVGAVLSAVLARRARRQGGDRRDGPRRRAPSPSDVGLDDDPIVAALGIGSEERRPRRVHRADRFEP